MTDQVKQKEHSSPDGVPSGGVNDISEEPEDIAHIQPTRDAFRFEEYEELPPPYSEALTGETKSPTQAPDSTASLQHGSAGPTGQGAIVIPPPSKRQLSGQRAESADTIAQGFKLVSQLENFLRQNGAEFAEPLKFKDAVGRKFSFPFDSCATWKVNLRDNFYRQYTGST
jgi:hypothetical protein